MICDLLKELREKKGLSRQQLADTLKIPKRTLESYEYGQREPNIEMINKFADFYGVSTDFLLGRPEAKAPVDPVEKFADDMSFEELETIVLKAYSELEPKLRQEFLRLMNNAIEKEKANRANIIEKHTKTDKLVTNEEAQKDA